MRGKVDIQEKSKSIGSKAKDINANRNHHFDELGKKRVFGNLPDFTGVFSEKENDKIKINIK